MDKKGIGTDATIAEHINTILQREYAEKIGPNNKYFNPTPLGLALVDGYDSMGFHLSQPDLRAAVSRVNNDGPHTILEKCSSDSDRRWVWR